MRRRRRGRDVDVDVDVDVPLDDAERTSGRAKSLLRGKWGGEKTEESKTTQAKDFDTSHLATGKPNPHTRFSATRETHSYIS
jgi:hypothetical protein